MVLEWGDCYQRACVFCSPCDLRGKRMRSISSRCVCVSGSLCVCVLLCHSKHDGRIGRRLCFSVWTHTTTRRSRLHFIHSARGCNCFLLFLFKSFRGSSIDDVVQCFVFAWDVAEVCYARTYCQLNGSLFPIAYRGYVGDDKM